MDSKIKKCFILYILSFIGMFIGFKFYYNSLNSLPDRIMRFKADGTSGLPSIGFTVGDEIQLTIKESMKQQLLRQCQYDEIIVKEAISQLNYNDVITLINVDSCCYKLLFRNKSDSKEFMDQYYLITQDTIYQMDLRPIVYE